MRITYRQLEQLIGLMNDDQKDCDVTAEIFDGENTESFAAELRIASEDSALDEDHPVLWVNQVDAPQRVVKLDGSLLSIEEIATEIGLG
jgi:hypothetical protein